MKNNVLFMRVPSLLGFSEFRRLPMDAISRARFSPSIMRESAPEAPRSTASVEPARSRPPEDYANIVVRNAWFWALAKLL
jgi:hypothetical protein